MAAPENLEDAMAVASATIRRASKLFAVGMEAVGEMQAQDEKWGLQRHPDGTGRGYGRDMLVDLDRLGADSAPIIADVAKYRADEYAKDGTLEWEQILTEEFFEALEESDPEKLRAELIQVAAVALNWVTDIDSRTDDIDDEEN